MHRWPGSWRSRDTVAALYLGVVVAIIGVFDARAGEITTARAIALERTTSDLIGDLSIHIVEGDETLGRIARAHDLGFLELLAANPKIDPWLPGIGTTLILPSAHILPNSAREGVVINLPEMRLYYFPKSGAPPVTYPIGIGRDGWETPLGASSIVRKRRDPTWVPTQSILAARPELPRSVPPGPDNPLGAFALNLGWTSYVIHGTNKPAGVGRRVSSGCIRLYPADIEALFEAVDVGTPVHVVDEPIKLGWKGDTLYMEAHVTQTDADSLEASGSVPDMRYPDIRPLVIAAAGEDADRINWRRVAKTLHERRGVPVAITKARLPKT